MAKLRPRARIVRTIGDQLISGPEAALIELVKNAYDADSPAVHIAIEPRRNGPNESDGRIIVSDRGHGMTANDLIEKWFEPATTDKVERRTSPGGRMMLGAKGVGRFATARLGRNLVLTCASRRWSSGLEVSRIEVDWSVFEHSKYLDEIDIGVQTRPGTQEEPTGVHLDISDLRDTWTKTQLEHLVRELRRLISPRGAQDSDFRIFLDLSAFQQETDGFDGQGLVSGALAVLEDGHPSVDPKEIKPFSLSNVYHYVVRGEFDENGGFSGTFTNQRADGQPQKLVLEPTALANGEAPCGPVKVMLNVYDREGDAVVELFHKLGLTAVGRMDAKRMLDENIGVGIYRSGFRIRPYGDAETDWLELERMRVQNPSRKLGLNQVWGIVDITDERVSGLIERSSREGLEHNGQFARLKRLIADLMARVEDIRLDFRQMVGLSRKQAGDTEDVRDRAALQKTQRAVASLPVQYREKVERALRQDSTALKTAIGELETYQQALASRSALGLVVSQVLHDGRRFLADIATRSKYLVDGAPRLMEQSKFGEHFRDSFGKSAHSISDSAADLNKLFKALDPISGRRRGRPKPLDVPEIVGRCLDLFKDAMATNHVEVDIQLPRDLPRATGYEGDLMAASLNIIDNAVHWLGTSPHRPRKLAISATFSKKYVRLSLSNSGPAIDDRFLSRLFTPGFTLKPEGSGIGLAIAREAMRASKGDVAYDDEADQTTFVIEMLRVQGD
ncbi:sensor histidine kinase [Ralstonia nicotianae]|uniref:histidine kinase n=1 Tax=Ralstonia solanacearum TaxID=305 RepID=A0A0S4WF25_RALSL|nr:ATPase domain-containing protein [Ralstonia solanacearum]